jgi:hypothetical protein
MRNTEGPGAVGAVPDGDGVTEAVGGGMVAGPALIAASAIGGAAWAGVVANEQNTPIPASTTAAEMLSMTTLRIANTRRLRR